MRAEWTEEQRTLLAHKQEELAELKSRLAPRQFEPASKPEPKPPQLEDWRKQRLVALCLLCIVNGSALITTSYHLLFTAPEDVELILTSEEVQRLIPEDHRKHGLHRLQIPSDDLAFQAYSKDHIRSDLLALAAGNLIFIAALIDAYRREARLLKQHAEH